MVAQMYTFKFLSNTYWYIYYIYLIYLNFIFILRNDIESIIVKKGCIFVGYVEDDFTGKLPIKNHN